MYIKGINYIYKENDHEPILLRVVFIYLYLFVPLFDLMIVYVERIERCFAFRIIRKTNIQRFYPLH